METLYDFITRQINSYQKPITLEDGWDWSMKDHLRRSFLYLNSQFEENNDDRVLRPNKNIVLAMLNVQYRTEGFDVKNIELFIDNKDHYYKSTLARKFHDKWALENEMDTFIDETVESYATYGGTLVRNVGKKRPDVVDLRTIAFCNQKNILANPFGFKHMLSQSELRDMEQFGWGKDEKGATISIEELIVLAKKEGKDEIKVYEVYGVLPSEYLQDRYNTIDEEKKDIMQMQVVSEYIDHNSQKVGVTLFKSKVPDLGKLFKFLSRDEIKGRALGRGGVEELFEPQVWTNWNEIKVTEMLESASKTIMLTDNVSIASKHKSGLKDMDNLEMIEAQPGSKGVWQVDTFPRNLDKFNQSLEAWNMHAQTISSSSDNLLGEKPSAGTPFKLFEAQTIESKGMHNYRQGKIATFVEQVYRDWALPYIEREIVTDMTFLSELSADEMIEISEKIAENKANKAILEKVLSGESLIPGEKEAMIEDAKNKFLKGGNKKFIDIVKSDFKDNKLAVRANIAGKQKNMALLTDKLVNVLKQYLATPEIRQDPGMNKILNNILESSGLSPIMFNPMPTQQAQPAQAQGGKAPLEQVANANQQNNVQQNV